MVWVKQGGGGRGSWANLLLLLLLLNRLPPDITGGQGLNGFQKLFFYNTTKNFIGGE
jgi:hypothetical protein